MEVRKAGLYNICVSACVCLLKPIVDACTQCRCDLMPMSLQYLNTDIPKTQRLTGNTHIRDMQAVTHIWQNTAKWKHTIYTHMNTLFLDTLCLSVSACVCVCLDVASQVEPQTHIMNTQACQCVDVLCFILPQNPSCQNSSGLQAYRK